MAGCGVLRDFIGGRRKFQRGNPRAPCLKAQETVSKYLTVFLWLMVCDKIEIPF